MEQNLSQKEDLKRYYKRMLGPQSLIAGVYLGILIIFLVCNLMIFASIHIGAVSVYNLVTKTYLPNYVLYLWTILISVIFWFLVLVVIPLAIVKRGRRK